MAIEPLRISAKNLGTMSLPGFCPQVFGCCRRASAAGEFGGQVANSCSDPVLAKNKLPFHDLRLLSPC